MPTTNKEREMRIAQKRVEGFAQQFGEAHRNLARHAAFPLVLTPDLLYQIWANFVPEAPWTAVAHVLLSRLCRQVGYEMYEMDIADRNLLLRELKEQFGQEKFDELGEFLLDYVAQRLTDDDADIRDLREAQEWTALAYTKPGEAARELAQRLGEMVQQDNVGEVLRLTSLIETLAEPLVEGGFEPLLVYSKGMENFACGNQEIATKQIAELVHNAEPIIKIGEVKLPIPSPILKVVTKTLRENSSNNLLRNLYNAFNPFEPLPAGDPNYVDCQDVRGDADIVEMLGNRICLANQNTYQLYSGHRGNGKSTELLRLKQYLENRRFYVVYFAADEEDIDSEDAQYTDILLACTRRLLKDLRGIASPRPLLGWLQGRWVELKDLAQTEMNFEDMEVEMQLSQFAKLTANMRAIPQLRQQIREKVNPHTVTLIKVLNEFLADAKKSLPNGDRQLAVIVDNLDRMVLLKDGDRTNYEEVFLDRSEQLKALDCHLIYTVPISMVYSKRATDLRDVYGDCLILPMIMVKNSDGTIYEPGLNKLREVIRKRVRQFAPALSLETGIFDSRETLDKLCLVSGGHVRNLLLLTQDAIGRTEELPITEKSVRRAITQARDTYRRTVENSQWDLLAEVAISKQIINDDQYRSLMYNRCLLEYRFLDDNEEMQHWYDIHPLIDGIPEFRQALQNLNMKLNSSRL